MKTIQTNEPPNWGCPNTEMRTRDAEFQASMRGVPGLDFKFNTNGPHYQSSRTRIAFSEWEKKNPA